MPRERTKLLSAHVVEVETDYLQDALDFAMTAGRTRVKLLHVDGLCVGVDTSAIIQEIPTPLPAARLSRSPTPMLNHQPVPAKANGFDRKSLNADSVLRAFELHGPTSTLFIGDQIGVARNDKLGRQKLSYLVGTLRKSGRLLKAKKTTVGIGDDYRVKGRPKAAVKVPAEETIEPDEVITDGDIGLPVFKAPIQDINLDNVRKILQSGEEILSMQIGDLLGIERKDGRRRIQVSKMINLLLSTGEVVKVGVRNGIQPVYKYIDQSGE